MAAPQEPLLEEVAKLEKDTMKRAADALAAAGFPCEIISSGSTPTFEIAVKDKTLNVSHPGNYTFFDNIQISLGTCGEDACSLRVLATVVSHPSEGFYLFDAGSKCLGLDQGRTEILPSRASGMLSGILS